MTVDREQFADTLLLGINRFGPTADQDQRHGIDRASFRGLPL
jgi:hypothetical protein